MTTLLTLDEVAAKARVSKSTVRREIERGNLRALHAGRRVLVREVEVERWLTAAEPPTTLRGTQPEEV